MEAMAAARRGTDPTVEERLYEEPFEFEFYQAVRLLELLRPGSASVGTGSDVAREAVRFRASPSLGFPASEVAGITPFSCRYPQVLRPEDSGPARMVTAFLGLAGGVGPLPRHITELLIERVSKKDTALRDFLDIFNHRLISLLYRARAKHRLNISGSTPQSTQVATYLYSLFGMGTGGLRGRMQVPDRALLRYAGLLGQTPRSAIGLERILTDYFQTKVHVQQFVGTWHRLEIDQCTIIGENGQNRALGMDTVLGTRIWDQGAGIELRVGPLTMDEFSEFIPSGTRWKALGDLTRFYIGMEISIKVRLLLAKKQTPALRLDPAHPPRLGWTTWLNSKPGVLPDSQVVLQI